MGGGWLSYLGMAPSIYPRTAVPTEYHTNFTEHPNNRVTTDHHTNECVTFSCAKVYWRAYEGCVHLDVAHELDIAHVRHGRWGPI